MIDEQQIYDRFCKDRFASVEKDIKENTAVTLEVRAKVFNGLTSAVEDTRKTVKSLYRLLWGLLVGLVMLGAAVLLQRIIP